jgi:hypothetical protein
MFVVDKATMFRFENACFSTEAIIIAQILPIFTNPTEQKTSLRHHFHPPASPEDSRSF